MQLYDLRMHLITDQPYIFRVMKGLPNFSITAQSSLSSLLRTKKVSDFCAAIKYLRSLPARSDPGAPDLLRVAQEGGTVCAKNAVLASLGRENNQPEVKLALCTYSVDFRSAPVLRSLLNEYGLPAVPEASCFLKYQKSFYTIAHESLRVTQPIVSDIEITPQQIGSFAQRYRHHHIEHWLQLENLHRTWTVDKIITVKKELRKKLEENPWLYTHPSIKA